MYLKKDKKPLKKSQNKKPNANAFGSVLKLIYLLFSLTLILFHLQVQA
ncbi:hypothetical protein SAMN02799633_02406 [Bacillus sp. UNCCL81]|nr:hypothetical protein SAMN02799633_02406 [Bacillus sp. UNCCL81]